MNLSRIAVTALLLVGSTPSIAAHVSGSDAHAILQDDPQCTQAPLTPANAVEQRTCLNEASVTEAGSHNVPLPPLENYTQSNLTSAQSYADGKMTREDYLADVAQNKEQCLRAFDDINADDDQNSTLGQFR